MDRTISGREGTWRLRAHLPTYALPRCVSHRHGGDTARRRLSALIVQGLPRPRRKGIIRAAARRFSRAVSPVLRVTRRALRHVVPDRAGAKHDGGANLSIRVHPGIRDRPGDHNHRVALTTAANYVVGQLVPRFNRVPVRSVLHIGGVARARVDRETPAGNRQTECCHARIALDVFHRRDRADTPFEGRRNVLHHCIPFRYCPASAGCIQETPVLPHLSSALARPVDGRDTRHPAVDTPDTSAPPVDGTTPHIYAKGGTPLPGCRLSRKRAEIRPRPARPWWEYRGQ